MKPIHPFLLLFLLAVTCISCSKYDDGPALSLRSKKERVCGNWELTEFTRNGENVLNNVTQGSEECWSGGTVYYTETTKLRSWYWNFTESGKLSYTVNAFSQTLNYSESLNECEPIYNTTSDVEFFEGFWAFEEKKEKISIGVGSPLSLDIKQLKEKEMKLEGDADGVKYVMTFKKR